MTDHPIDRLAIVRLPFSATADGKTAGPGRCAGVAYNGLIYAVSTDPAQAATIEEQTASALAELLSCLTTLGADKRGLLKVTIYLQDIADKVAMDTVWCSWIGGVEIWPQRACLGVDLPPGDLIEIVAVAAQSREPLSAAGQTLERT